MMIDLNKYVTEKLVISKNVRTFKNNKEIKNTIEDYLISFTYLGNDNNKRSYEIKFLDGNKIEIYVEQESRPAFWNGIGRDIVKKIKENLKVDAEFSTAVDDHKIYIDIK